MCAYDSFDGPSVLTNNWLKGVGEMGIGHSELMRTPVTGLSPESWQLCVYCGAVKLN
jgi:hypothetical protein